MKNEREDITTDSMDFKIIIKEYYEQICDHKFDNLEEMYQCIERHNLLKLTQEKIDNLNRLNLLKH